MRMDSAALKFDPQVMALAMPSESGFSKAAEGIGNVGKVFLEADKRQEESKLNALKMEEANQSILAKKNDNSVFDEKQERERESHVLTKRNSMLDILKKDREEKSAYQKALDDESTKTLASWTPKEAYMNADGTPDRAVMANTKAALLASPEWKDKGHVVNAWFDTLEGNIFKGAKSDAELKESAAKVAKEKELTKGYTLDNDHKPKKFALEDQKDEASVAATKALTNQRTTAAKLNTANADNVSKDGSTEGKPDMSAKGMQQRLDDIKMGRMPKIIPGYDNLQPSQQKEVNDLYYQRGSRGYVKENEDGVYQMFYPEGSLKPKASAKVPVKSAGGSTPKAKPTADDEVTRLLNK